MITFRTLTTLGFVSTMVIATPAFATTAASATKAASKPHVMAVTKPAATPHIVPAKPAAANHVAAAKPAAPHVAAAAKPSIFARATAPAARPATRISANHATGRMVTTRTSTGKTITYNCSLAGNQTKQACKG
jgi:myo-inositol-hexaphosphate 3-phosphohydrolase